MLQATLLSYGKSNLIKLTFGFRQAACFVLWHLSYTLCLCILEGKEGNSSQADVGGGECIPGGVCIFMDIHLRCAVERTYNGSAFQPELCPYFYCVVCVCLSTSVGGHMYVCVFTDCYFYLFFFSVLFI